MTTSTTTFRSFEFSEGNSNKFWEIAIQGTDVTVRYGRIGSAGQTSVKSLPDDIAAMKHANNLIKQKTGKGYTEVRP